MIETRHLRLIKAIVEEGSITSAMNVLHLSQSALSCQLKEAESRLGTEFFYRVNKKLILTPAGKRLYITAKRIIMDMEETENEIKGIISGDKGIIRISSECFTSYSWLPSAIQKFNKDFPHVEVDIVFEATQQPIDRLIDGGLDIAITSTPSHVDRVEYIPFFTDEMYAVVSNQHLWANKDYVHPDDFQDAILIVQSLPIDTVSIFKSLLTPRAIYPKKVILLPLTEAAIELIKVNMGVMVLPGWALEPHFRNNLEVVKITSAGFIRQHYLTKIRNRNCPLYLDYFIKYLREGITLDDHLLPKIIPFPSPKAKLSLTKN